MPCTVNVTSVFGDWFRECEEDLQDSITACIVLLASEGPQLGRPHADTLNGSSIPNLKELRVPYRGVPYRIPFAFDPNREALLLLGGNKASDKRWYVRAIKQAEQLYGEHLKNLE